MLDVFYTEKKEMSDIPRQDSEVSPQQRQGLALALVGEGAAPCCEGEGG